MKNKTLYVVCAASALTMLLFNGAFTTAQATTPPGYPDMGTSSGGAAAPTDPGTVSAGSSGGKSACQNDPACKACATLLGLDPASYTSISAPTVTYNAGPPATCDMVSNTCVINGNTTTCTQSVTTKGGTTEQSCKDLANSVAGCNATFSASSSGNKSGYGTY